ncbi:MAG: sigma-54-dependent Fis family transcriptional regulator [Candidatus Abyssobacteria bacterium SURF_17]|uniref:Sigma-54-dependent Fis family transcriptional regulator n=1 Tax=Candidatus Abyssobacteria bacterium SURF_17 TaxID=2093361 RepID=A0A419ER75_9BACT|nr:MAG: sigma-54-dependent Fis family transcriptional regulator [Candidatus Abyssubacteria bacterium SURF_17]
MTDVTPSVRVNIAIIDDDDAARESIGQMLRLRGFGVEEFPSAIAALEWVPLCDAHCVIADVKMPWMDGEQFLAEVKKRNYQVPVIMLTGHGDIPMAVRCLKSGAYDFLEKPFEEDVLLASVRRAVELTKFRHESEELRRRLDMMCLDEDQFCGMVGRSRVMQDVYEQIRVYARSDAPVLILGETGVGKELAARAIHSLSARVNGPFVPVNAGALSETLLESELFGHARGAFTGATFKRDGKIVMASGGTLLLDEIESLSERAQVHLLRVIEDGLVQPLGQDELRSVDVRVVATTNVNLRELVQQGRIREDFYHRINVLTIVIPPLRERREDIPLLASHFSKAAANRSGIPVPRFPEETFGKMMTHSWPGNIRELKNAIERMVITSSRGVTGSFEMDESFVDQRLLSLPATPGRLHDAMELTERQVIESALREHHGEVGATSGALGISRRALYERMKKYGLIKEQFKARGNEHISPMGDSRP